LNNKNINWEKSDESTGVPSLPKTVINNISVSISSHQEQKKGLSKKKL